MSAHQGGYRLKSAALQNPAIQLQMGRIVVGDQNNWGTWHSYLALGGVLPRQYN
jgi:hypothetical protein